MKLFVVRGENGGEPESYLLGVYDNFFDADARRAECEIDENFDEDEEEEYDENTVKFEYAWVDEVELGAAVLEANR